MRKARQIALAFPVTIGVVQDTVQGILEYAEKHGPWTCLCGSETLVMSVLSLKGWPGDGVIAGIYTRQEALAAARLRLPVVNLAAILADTGLPCVMNDHRAIGRLAAEHLLHREFRRFGYYGLAHTWYSEERCRGFTGRVEREGYSCAVHTTTGIAECDGTWHHWQEKLRRWMGRLQRPLAIMAANDVLARMVADTCRQLGWHMPHDVAVIGVGDNTLICGTSQPTLSSVARNGKEIGYRAAQLLHRLMSGRPPSKTKIIVAPAGVVARQSTEVVAIEDPDLTRAVRYIYEHLDQPLKVADLIRDMAVSRRWLEYRFREQLGRSPHEYICEARIERAKQLLLEPRRLPVAELAGKCGFSRARTFQRTFQRLTGVTPAQYRRREMCCARG